MSALRRAAARVRNATQPLRKAPEWEQKRLGKYPVPPETHVWWLNRTTAPGGYVMQSVSPYQQKIMWQWFHNFPTRWYTRVTKHTFPTFIPALTFYILWKIVTYDVEENLRNRNWF
mmetsp:Transcript_46869/g.123939  ORF Transcript_46869/g.123939 Transcript_46869/m.123939 type:complete len:116 (-) Transcript_46869:79-426(-)